MSSRYHWEDLGTPDQWSDLTLINSAIRELLVLLLAKLRCLSELAEDRSIITLLGVPDSEVVDLRYHL